MIKFIKKHKIASLFIFVITALVLSAFYLQLNSVRNELDLLEKYDLVGLSTEEIVSRLDSITSEDKGFKASISSTKLTMSENGVEVEYDILSDLFYLSFAPYINNTHPCKTHYLSSCRSELKNELFNVTITNDSGEVLFSKEVKSMENGFIGIWLPSGIKGTLKINYGDKTAESEISTLSTDNTCLTEPLRLK